MASWFAVTQTFVVSLVLWAIVLTLRKLPASKRQQTGWLILALFFSYLTMDDGAKVHERLGTAFEITHKQPTDAASSVGLGAEALRVYPSYPWQILFGPVLGAMAMFIMLFLWNQLPRQVDRIRMAVALICFVIAVGLDFVEGLEAGYRWLTAFGFDERDIRHFSKSLEEFLEMLGIAILLVVFLNYLAHIRESLLIRSLHSESTRFSR